MCNNSDIEQDGVMLMDRAEKPDLIGKWCRKCVDKTQAKVVLRGRDAYCKQCFLSSVTHKFRACLGKSKTMRPGDKVLIGFSGNENSIALLHLIGTGLQDTSHKKLMFSPYIIYIDEAEALNLTTDEVSKINENIKQIIETYKYSFYTVPLELSTKSEEAINNYLAGGSYSADDNTIHDLFAALTDRTSKMDLLNKLRHKLLVQAAKSLACNKVFTAETANDLAVKLFTNVSLGRGAQIPYDVGFSDDRFPEVKVVRPLRDLSKKEVIFYNVFHNLTSVHIPSILTKTDAHSSIHKLTESFLCDLQDGFPSTLSTVFRIADKLTTNPGELGTCALCEAPLDTEEKASSSLNATQFSRLLSLSGPSNYDANGLTVINSSGSACCSENIDNKCCQSSGLCSNITTEKELKDKLCYGCNLIFKDADKKTLPAQIIQHLREASQLFKMKKEIDEFLL